MLLIYWISRVINKIKMYLCHKYAIFILKKCNATFSEVSFFGYTELFVKGRITIGKGFICRSGVTNCINSGISKIFVSDNAELIIGVNSGMSNTYINCYERIEIGDNVNIGAGTMIFDSNFHSVNPIMRQNRYDDIRNLLIVPIINPFNKIFYL